MRSEWLRFQAQYLRRIPVPAPTEIAKKNCKRLADLDGETDLEQIDAEVARLYDLADKDVLLIRTALSRQQDLDEPTQSCGLDKLREESAQR